MDVSKLTNSEKITLLTFTLKERYESIHKIRERVQSMGIYILGILGGVGSWLIQSDTSLSFFQKEVYVIALLLAFIVLRFYYFEDLERGFKGQLITAARIEKMLGYFTPNFINGLEETVHDPKWAKAGTNGGSGAFFKTTYKLLYIGFSFILVTVIFNGCAL